MPPNPSEPEHRNLGNLLRRTQAIAVLPDLLAQCQSDTLQLDGSRLTEFSPCAAVIVRAAIDYHLSRGVSRVTVVEPRDSACWEQMSELMTPEPGVSWHWAQTRSAVPRQEDVYLPASVINAETTSEELALMTKMAAAGLGAPPRAPGLLADAAAIFLDNVRAHSASAHSASAHSASAHSASAHGPPILCAARHQPAKELEVVCFNLQPEEATLANVDQLRAAVQGSDGHPGSLTDLTALPHGGLDFVVRVAAGTGSGRRSPSRGRWDWRDAQHAVPGFLAALEIKF